MHIILAMLLIYLIYNMYI